MKKAQLILTTMVICVLGTFYYVFNHTNMNERYSSKKLNLALEREVNSLDPALVFNDDALTLISQSLETLYQYHYLKRPFEVVPLLAEKMPEVSADGLIYKIPIKKGVYFHDHPAFLGRKRELKAFDFINQIKRLIFKPLNSSGRSIVENRIKGVSKFLLEVGSDFKKLLVTNLDGVRATDDYTLEIELTQPDPNIIYFLSMTFTTPVPKEVLMYHENDLDEVLIGTGPFYLFKTFKNQKYNFKKFEHFHNELYPSSGDRYANTQDLLVYAKKSLPFIDEVVFTVIPSADVRFSEFQEGRIDLLSVPPIKIEQITDPNNKIYQNFTEQKIKTKMFSTLVFRWLGFNMQDELFKNKKYLRQAIAYAIDYDEYANVLNRNTSLRANSIYNPGIPGYNPSHKISYEYNPKKSLSIIKKNKFNIKKIPTIKYSTRGNEEINILEAKFIKESLEKIGLKVEIEILDFKDFLSKGRAGQLQFWTDSWIYDYPDAENLLQLLLSSNHPGINKSAYANKKFDFLYGKLAETRDLAERLTYMERMEKIVLDDLPWIPLYYETSYTINWPKVKNYRKSFFTRNFTKYLDLK